MADAPTDWQHTCTDIKQRGAYLLQSGELSDCTFSVGTEPHPVLISGHKLILAKASPVFEKMFYGAMAERNDPIRILDLEPEVFRSLLEYVYTDSINITSYDNACELCYGAKKYMLPHLFKECTKYLGSGLNPRNACRAYEFACLYEEDLLMEKCIQIISTNTKEVLNDSSFEDVELNTVISVFSLDHLNIDSELDLFEAAVRYDKAQDKRTTEGSVGIVGAQPQKDGDVGEHPSHDNKHINNKPKIRSAIEKIRFLTLTPQQFAEGPARSSLLTESEAFAVFMNMASSNSDVPMPSGFSTSRLPRSSGFSTSRVPRNESSSKYRLAEIDESRSSTRVKVLKEPLSIGSRIVVTGTFSIMSRFGVCLQCESLGGDIPVAIYVNLQQRVVVRNTRRAGAWGREETAASRPFPFKDGQRFTMEIVVEKTETRLAIDGEHYCTYAHRDPSPLSARYVRVIKDATLNIYRRA